VATSPTTRRTLVSPSSLRLAGWGFLVVAVLLLLWIGVLAVTLPDTAHVRNWAEAWVGFDLLECAGLVVTGWLVLRRDPRVVVAASATAAFLVADAWFDIVTSQPDWDVVQATVLALVVELPLAAICGVIAFTAPRWARRPATRS
jgi:hypothetical protein